MQTVLYISPMTLGDELEVRRIHDAFPLEALSAGVGVEAIKAFIGSGNYALEITVADGDFQEQFHQFLATPDVTLFLDQLRPFVQNLPTPDMATADMPMATEMLVWQRSL